MDLEEYKHLLMSTSINLIDGYGSSVPALPTFPVMKTVLEWKLERENAELKSKLEKLKVADPNWFKAVIGEDKF